MLFGSRRDAQISVETGGLLAFGSRILPNLGQPLIGATILHDKTIEQLGRDGTAPQRDAEEIAAPVRSGIIWSQITAATRL